MTRYAKRRDDGSRWRGIFFCGVYRTNPARLNQASQDGIALKKGILASGGAKVTLANQTVVIKRLQ